MASPRAARLILAVLLAVPIAGMAYFFGAQSAERHLDRILALSWDDRAEGKYGAGFYGAEVFVVDPKETPVRVAALIHLGRGNGYDYNCGLLGTAKDMNDAAFQWGAVTWTASGVELGRAPTMKIINRAEFENHR